MSDTAPAPSGAGEGAAAPVGITDEASAVEALKGLFSEDIPKPKAAPQATQEESSPPGDDAGSPETETTGEDEEGQPDDEAEASEAPPPPGIDPPKSWSADDQAIFRKLPPDAQHIVARRESERDRAFLARSQEIAAERNAISGERETYDRSLQQLLHLALPEIQQYQNIDWQRLSVEAPAEYVRLSAQRDALRQRVDALVGEQGRVRQQMSHDGGRQRAEVLAEQKQRLIEKVPEFSDPAKAQKLAQDLTTHLGHYGYDPAEVAEAIDHRAILVAQDAMRWRQHVAARASAEQKRTAPAPSTLAPGTPRQTNNSERRIKEKFARLNNSGSVRDAASIIREML